MSETYIMPPHFPVVAEALATPISRLQEALCTHHRLTGSPFLLDNFQSEWAMSMNWNIESIADAVNQLGQKVMAPDCEVTNGYARQMIEALDRAIGKYIFDTENFLSRPWPDGMAPGRVLVAAIMEKPMRELLELFEQVRFVILDPEKAVAKYGGTKINLTMSLNIDSEVQAFRVWAENTEQWMQLKTSFLAEETFYKKPASRSCFSSILAGAFLGWWIGGD